jgi:hypothetical protein
VKGRRGGREGRGGRGKEENERESQEDSIRRRDVGTSRKKCGGDPSPPKTDRTTKQR